MVKTLITFPSHHKGVFSRSYLGKINKKKAFIKIYEQNMLKMLSMDIGEKHQLVYKIASNLKIIPELLYIDENLIIQEYIINNKLKKKEFFKDKNIKVFKKVIGNFNNIDVTKLPKLPKLYEQIINYKKILKKNDFFNTILSNKKYLSKYIDKYTQKYLCHGDLHLNNIIMKKNKIFLIDLDYICISSRGYDIAMLAHLEKLSKKKIKEISYLLEIDINEINHYKPLCMLLDYLWQEAQLKLKIIKKNKINKEIIKNFLKRIS